MRTCNSPHTTDRSEGKSLETELAELFSRFEPDQEMIDAQKFIDEALRYVQPQQVPDVEVEVSAIGTEDDADKK